MEKMGENAGYNAQGNFSVAIGRQAGEQYQQDYAVAIGPYAGQNGTQKYECVAIGSYAGNQAQGGTHNGGGGAVAVGTNAGRNDQGYKATAIGFWAGGNWNNNGGSGDYSVSIGADAGGSGGTPEKTIIINASGQDLSPSETNAFFVRPIDTSRTGNYNMYWNSSTYEVVCGGSSSDDRLKHHERDINNGLEIIRKLKPQFYKKTHAIYETDISGTQLIPKLDSSGNKIFFDSNYNGDIGLEGYQWNYCAGLIAQDVKLIDELKFAVHDEQRKYDKSNNLTDISPMGLDYENIFTYNIAATKELDAIVEEQKQEINKLKQEIIELKQEFKDENDKIKRALYNLDKKYKSRDLNLNI